MRKVSRWQHRAGRVALSFIWLGALSALASPAAAYVRTRTPSGTPVHWEMRCIVLSPDARGDQSGDDITNDDIESTLVAATSAWNDRIQTCGTLELGVNPPTQALAAVSDGRPALVFDSVTWGRDGMAYDPSIIALTTVWYSDHPNDATDGEISDADIELDAVNFTFTTTPASATARPGTEIADLQNTLTHELGHVMGLAHTCWDHTAGEPTAPLDNNGNPAPDCYLAPDLPPAIMDATMYPYSTPGSTAMRTVGDDDLAGVCDSYPDTAEPMACYGYIKNGGCAYGGAGPGSLAITLLVLLGMGATRIVRGRV